ncbi:MAG: glycosyltransferase family 2 protein [Candidatus Omnitrophica bacterium]|nr:glycosyltransferase family 2 protein [Candidatus Omnitrophota bacterium]
MSKVSVLIPAYNPVKEHLHECLESVFAQSFKDCEVIIVDDGSSVDVKEMLLPFADKVKYLRKENGGANSARLLGLQESQGEYIALIDNDDLWVLDKLEKQVKFLDEYPEVDLIFSNFQNFNSDGPIGRNFFDQNKVIRGMSHKTALKAGSNCKIFTEDVTYDYLRGDFIIQCTFMVRVKTCKELKIFETSAYVREFHEFGTQSIHLLGLGYIDEVLAHRRIHGTNTTLNMEKVFLSTIEIYQKALGYSWMDAQCRKYLKKELIKAQFLLGKYDFVKGDFEKAREVWERLLGQGFHLRSMTLLYLTYIISPSVVLQLSQTRNQFLSILRLNKKSRVKSGS